MNELNEQQLEMILLDIRRYKAEHPKANVGYDPVFRRINITYPLPKDFDVIKDIKFFYNEDIK